MSNDAETISLYNAMLVNYLLLIGVFLPLIQQKNHLQLYIAIDSMDLPHIISNDIIFHALDGEFIIVFFFIFLMLHVFS